MPFKSLVRELKEKTNGSGSMPRRRGRTERPMIAQDRRGSLNPSPNRTKLEVRQGRWADLPPELLSDIIRRVEESEVSWPARRSVLGCAAACRSWRDIMKEIIRSPEECGRITFPFSLKQPAPRDYPIQCFIKRERAKSTFRLYLGLTPSLQGQNDKLLLAARKIRRATSTYFVISLTANDFSLASNTCIGKVRSNFLGTKFMVYDTQPAYIAALSPGDHSSQRINSKRVSHRTSISNCAVATISYELNVLPTRGPRRMHCTMHSIPISSIKEGGKVPPPHSSIDYIHGKTSRVHAARDKKPVLEFSSTSLTDSHSPAHSVEESLALKNKPPRWHEQLQCWCLNFRGRVTMASVKNFQLVAAIKPSCSISPVEQEKVILQFGKIGKDIFTMDYKYPLSAFQAFAICLTSFDSKRACE